jgi:hypothetical protein
MICASLRCSDRVSSDTLVATPTGKTAISEIRVGDTVEAYDPRTGVTGPHTVTAVMAHTDPVVEHLVTDTGPIETTPNHPFFTTDRGWVEAGSLAIGEQVRTESRKPATVVSFTVSATPSTMWDLTVDGAHSFFVGSGAVSLKVDESTTIVYHTPWKLDPGDLNNPPRWIPYLTLAALLAGAVLLSPAGA